MGEDEIKNLIPEFLLNSGIYSLVIIDLEGRYLFGNNVFRERFSSIPDDYIGYPSLNTIHPEDHHLCIQAMEYCFTNPERTVRVDLRKLKDINQDYFQWTSWEFSVFKDKDKNHIGVLCLGHDITKLEIIGRQAEELAQKIETIVEEITDGFYQLDKEYRFTKINKVAEQILGIAREDLLGKCLWDLFPDTPDYNYPSQYRKTMEENKTITFEDYLYGSDKWFSTVVYPSVEGLTVFFKDVTQEKKNQERIKDSENKLRAILDSTTDSNILVSPDYKILCFNKQADKVSQTTLGKPLQELVDIKEYILPLDKEVFSQDVQKALEGEYLKFEKEIFFYNSSVWFEVGYSPVYDTEGNILGVTFNTTNIDARKKSEIQLKQSETMLKALYNSTSEGSTFVDKDFRIVFNNRLAQEITQSVFGKAAQVGDKSLDYYIPDLQEEFAGYYQRVLQGETIYVEKNHQGICWRFSLFPVYDGENNIVGIADNVKDISRRKQSELEILKKNESLRQIAWQQSHEVRRPLANIIGLCGLIKEGGGTEEEKQTYIDYLLQATQELDEIIHKIVHQSS